MNVYFWFINILFWENLIWESILKYLKFEDKEYKNLEDKEYSNCLSFQKY